MGGFTLLNVKACYSNQASRVLGTQWTCRSKEQKRESRNRSTHICPTDFLQRHKSNSLEKGTNKLSGERDKQIISTNDAGAIGHQQKKVTKIKKKKS